MCPEEILCKKIVMFDTVFRRYLPWPSTFDVKFGHQLLSSFNKLWSMCAKMYGVDTKAKRYSMRTYKRNSQVKYHILLFSRLTAEFSKACWNGLLVEWSGLDPGLQSWSCFLGQDTLL